MVVDETGLFSQLQSTRDVRFQPMAGIAYARRQLYDGQADALLYIPLFQTALPRQAVLYFRAHTPSMQVQSSIDHQLQSLLRNAILEDVYGLSASDYQTLTNTRLRLSVQDAATGRDSFTGVKSAAAAALALLMALTLMVFASQVMRGVREERQNRVMEVVATSVRPGQLLVGKLCGVALTALVQLLLWGSLTLLAVKAVQWANPDLFSLAASQQQAQSLDVRHLDPTAAPTLMVDHAMQGLTAIDLPLMGGMFLLFFVLGYLVYGALLAAAASRSDTDAEPLAAVLLGCAPLLLAAVLLPVVLATPDGTWATALTLVPFTAPVAVLARLPFGLPWWQVATAAAAMLATAAALSAWAARIYRKNLLPRS